MTTVRQEQQAAKFARYTVLRDEGERPADAAREIGLGDSTYRCMSGRISVSGVSRERRARTEMGNE